MMFSRKNIPVRKHPLEDTHTEKVQLLFVCLPFCIFTVDLKTGDDEFIFSNVTDCIMLEATEALIYNCLC